MNEREFREQLIREMMKQHGFDGSMHAGRNGQPHVNPNTGEPIPQDWDLFFQHNTPEGHKRKDETETWQEHSRRILKDWEPHYNEKSSQGFFIRLINLMCERLRKKGLYVHLKEHNDNRAVLRVSYDHPGAKEQTFVLKNEDGINYSWHKAMTSWRDL